jgi:beta-glucosidase-like glycosyl hydrolase
MGGVLKAGPIEQAAVQHIRAGGDLCLICHEEEGISRSFEALTHEAERDRRFARRMKESAARMLVFKKKVSQLKRVPPPPEKIEKLSRTLREFGEQVRLEAIKRQNFVRGEQA